MGCTTVRMFCLDGLAWVEIRVRGCMRVRSAVVLCSESQGLGPGDSVSREAMSKTIAEENGEDQKSYEKLQCSWD